MTMVYVWIHHDVCANLKGIVQQLAEKAIVWHIDCSTASVFFWTLRFNSLTFYSCLAFKPTQTHTWLASQFPNYAYSHVLAITHTHTPTHPPAAAAPGDWSKYFSYHECPMNGGSGYLPPNQHPWSHLGTVYSDGAGGEYVVGINVGGPTGVPPNEYAVQAQTRGGELSID
jgi:hypothetical protein